MNKKFNLAGYIEYSNNQYFCTVIDYVVKLFYMYNQQYYDDTSNDIEAFFSGENNEIDEETFLYGFDEKNRLFAVLTSKLKKDLLSSHTPYTFGTPLLIIGKPNTKKLTSFDGIVFYGKTVNKVFSPRRAVKYPRHESMLQGLEFKPSSDFHKEFDIDFDGQQAKIGYSISWTVNFSEQKDENGRLSLGSVDSCMYIKFENPQPLEMLKHYYLTFSNVLRFLTGRKNVDFHVKLQCKNEANSFFDSADCFFNREDNDIYNGKILKTIQIDALDDKIACLFKLFADKKTEPYLQFLPDSNRVANWVTHTDVLDICTAFEKEFKLSKHKIQSSEIANALYEALSTTIKDFRDTKTEEEYKKNKIFDVAFSSIKHIESSLSDKIHIIYEHSLACPQQIPAEELDVIKESINKFVKLRNSITHSGIIDLKDDDRVKVYITLQRILYTTILARAGVDKATAVELAERKWIKDTYVVTNKLNNRKAKPKCQTKTNSNNTKK